MKLNFTRIIQNKISQGFRRNREKLPTPIISIAEQTPSKIIIEWQSVINVDNVFVQYCEDANFSCGTSQTITGTSFTLEGEKVLSDTFFRVRFIAEGFRSSDFAIIETQKIQPTQISVSNFQAQGLNGEIQLSWSEPNDISEVSGITISRREIGGTFTLLNTLPNTTTSYSDGTAINEVEYEYKVNPIVTSIDFVSVGLTVTSQAITTPKLSTPNNLQVSFTQVNGEVNLTWNSVNNANQYRILFDGIFNQNIATNSVLLTSLVINQQYQVQVIAQDTTEGFLDSNVASTNFTVPDVDNEDFLTLEQFGGEAWYLPVDGRFYNNLQFPTITYIPYSADNSIISGTGLTGDNYTLIESNLPNTFPTDVVGKRFCGLWANQNPVLANPSAKDEYFAGIVGSRYSTCVHRIDDTKVIVDFEYNGGNRATPQILENGKGYFFFDNTDSFNSVFTAWGDLSTSNKIKLQNDDMNGFVLKGYIVPEFNTVNLNIEKDLRIEPINLEQSSVLKIGYEDYYYQELKSDESPSISNPTVLFSFSNGYPNTMYLANIKLTTPHRTIISDTRLLFGGNRLGGITAIINGDSYWEHTAIENGIGINNEKFVLSKGTLSGGTYTETPIPDVEEFAIVASTNTQFTGANCLGRIGGSAAGGTLFHDINSTFDFENQGFWTPTKQEVTVRITNDKTGLPTELQPSYYPNQVIEITSETGNYFITLQLGSYRAWNAVIIKDPNSNKPFCFYLTAQGIRPDNENSFWGYWDWCYRGSEQKQSWDWANQRGPNFALSSTKAPIYGKIPTENEVVHVSRDYSRNETENQIFNQPGQFGTVNEFRSNIIRSAICWSTVLGKFAKDFNQADRDLMFGKIPIELQPGDEFKIPNSETPNKIYKVIRKEVGFLEESPGGTQWNREFQHSDFFEGWEFRVVGLNLQSFPFWKYVLDDDLPLNTEITFDIEIITSNASILLNGVETDAEISYMATNKRLGNAPITNTNTGFVESTEYGSSVFDSGGGLGHLAYNVGQLSYLFIGCNFNNGFFRMNTNNIPTNNLRRFTKGHHMIDCINPPTGQWGGSGSAPGSTRTQFESANDILDADPDYIPHVISEGWPRGVYQSYIDMIPGISSIINQDRNLLVGTSEEHLNNIPSVPTSFQNLLNELNITP